MGVAKEVNNKRDSGLIRASNPVLCTPFFAISFLNFDPKSRTSDSNSDWIATFSAIQTDDSSKTFSVKVNQSL